MYMYSHSRSVVWKSVIGYDIYLKNGDELQEGEIWEVQFSKLTRKSLE